MTADQEKNIYAQAVEVFGARSQVDKAKEELIELVEAILDWKSGQGSETAMHDEIADVLIMLEQLQLMFSREEVLRRKVFKLQRLQGLIENERRLQAGRPGPTSERGAQGQTTKDLEDAET